MRGFLIGLILGILLVPAAAFLYLRYGHPPVAVADPSFPFEAQIVHVPLDRRVESEAPKQAPIEPSETNLEAGAHIYRDQCAGCHGLYGRPAPFAKMVFPSAPQLWQPHGHGVVGVSDDPAGETYWKVDNGIRLTAMPSFRKELSSTQMWQVSLLLANADKPLPGNTLDLLKQPLAGDSSGSGDASAPVQ